MTKQSDADRAGSAGELIQERRRAAGLTQRALAERSGVSVGAIRDLEQGRTSRPRPGAVPGLIRALGLQDRKLALLAGPQGGARRDAGAEGRPASQGRERVDGIRVAVLGPLVAWRDGVPTDLGGERQRAVLALLAMSAGQAVNRASIIDAIWGEAPPPSAVSMIQSYVSRLRDALGLPARATATDGRGRLASVGESYLLQPGPGQTDLREFAALAARARQRAAAGDAAGSCELFARALGLWRGEVAADVGLLRGHPAAAALARQRTAVVLEYADVAAAAGWHGRVVEPLRALAEREPLDERALTRLMTALGATGQQAAALRVFEEARVRLDQELGVTPGPELAQAHLQILRGEPGPSTRPAAAAADEDPADADRPQVRRGARSGGAGSPGATVLPRQLPAAVGHFAGREAELKALWEVLDQASERLGAVVISAIGGMAGVGKTALAVHWAQQAADRFPDGQLFADLRGFGPAGDPADPARVIGWFLASLGVPATQIPADPQAQAALLRSVLAGKRMLIVLDNAADADQVRPLLPGSPGCLVLVTSRARLTGLAAADGATVLDLDVLDAHEATELLARRLDRSRLAAERAAVADLVELCGRLPLALAITAARAAARPGFSLAELAAELRDEADRLDALDTGEPASSIRQVFSWSYRQLSDPAARMFRLLGIHPGPDISVSAAASLAGVSPAAARYALAELTGAHLLAEPSPGRCALHDLLRTYAAELAAATDPEPHRRAALGSVLDHYLHTAHHAVLLINPSREEIALAPARPGVRPERFADYRQALAWFEAEHQVLLAAAALAADTRSDAGAWQLAWAVANFLDGQGRWQDMAIVQRGALDAATRLGDTAGQSVTRSALANTYASLGDYQQARAHLAALLSLSRQLGDRAREARVHLILGFVYDRQERFADALSHAEQALVLFRAIADPPGQTSALNAVGWCHARLGDYQQARTFCQQALAAYREIGDHYGESTTLDSLGYAEHHLGRYADAVISYNRAIALKAELGDRVGAAETFDHLGDTHHAAGHRDAARHAWQQALGILDDLEHPGAGKVRAKLL